MDGLGEGFLVLDNDGQTVEGTAVLGTFVGSVLGSVVIDDDLILFVSFNCSNRLVWVWSVERSLAIKLYDQ